MMRQQFPLPPMESSRRWSPPPAPLQFQNDENDNPDNVSTSHPNSYHHSSSNTVQDRNVGASNVSSTSYAPPPDYDNRSTENYTANHDYSNEESSVIRLFGSIFSQVRCLPRKTLSHSSILSSDRSTTGEEEVTKDDLYSLKDIPIPPSTLTNHQRNKNLHLLRSWTDEGHYSRVKAMTIASILYNRKVTEGDIRAELTPKEKFAYKKFCLEIEDKLEMITSREPTRRREPFTERTLRKIWHLYALYTKALSDEIWDETSAKSDITSRAIAHLVKRAIAGGPGDNINPRSSTRSSISTPTLKPVDPLESVNPVLASSLKDPIQAFLIVYGRYVSTGKVNQVERLRKLVHFNEIAEEFFQKLVEPPENVDIDTYLLLLRQQQQQFQHQQKWSCSGFTGYGGKSSISMPFTFSHTYPHSRSSDHRSKKRNKQKQRSAISTTTMTVQNSGLDEKTSLEKLTQQNEETSRRGGGGTSCPPPAVSCPLPVEIPPPTDNDVKSLQRKIQMLDGYQTLIMWYSCPPSPITNFQSPPTPGSRVCSVISILPDPPVRPSPTLTLLAVCRRLESGGAKFKKEEDAEEKEKESDNNATTTSTVVAVGGGDDSGGIDVPPKKRVILINNFLPKKRPPPLKELLNRSKPADRPATAIYKELDQDARHILRGRFFPKGYVPSTPPSSPKNPMSRPTSPYLISKKRICLTGCRYEVLPQVAISAGFEIVGENDLWNIIWSDTPLAQEKIMQMRRIQDMYSVFWGLNAPLQKCNHFPGMYEICRKDRLGRNLNRLKRLFPGEYNFFPETFDLPTEQSELIAYSRRRKKNNMTFIIKPESGCQGKGIFLLRNLKKLSPFAKCVCQLYIPHPFLIDGYKFDQRIYVLITCVDPLRLYIYDEGIARFATVKYEVPTEDNLEVVFMHLTNYSLNKFSESYVREGDGSKRTLSSVYLWMSENGYDVQKLIRAIDEIVVKTLLCASPTLKHNYKTSFPKKDRGCSCFELLGFDILIDRHLNPILLEVNHSPSFNLDLPVDHYVKTALLKDMLNMVYLGEELSQYPNPQLFRAKQISSSKKKKSNKKLAKSKKSISGKQPAAAEEVELSDGISKALQQQFKHEMKNRGRFRLIYSSDKPGRFQKLCSEDNYCGYNVMSTAPTQERQMVLFDRDPDNYNEHKEHWRPPRTSSTLKITKRGQKYVETRVIDPDFTNSPQNVQKFREIPGRSTDQRPSEARKSRSKVSSKNSISVSSGKEKKEYRKRRKSGRPVAAKVVMCSDDAVNSDFNNNNHNHYQDFAATNEIPNKDRPHRK